ncbi:MAG: phosphoenolpyruvate kinase [Deltaproteobacteria bacterium]|nr:phosphoenolpyruvate kinase [Deltaproteobacteria bacterium]
MKLTLSDDVVRGFLARCGPEAVVGEIARQPVHVVYGGAHLFSADTPLKLGDLARRAFEAFAQSPHDLGEALGLPAEVRVDVHARVRAKLAREPVEDLRIDFEDGFGLRSDDEEDETAQRTAEALATVAATPGRPLFLGLRIKALDAASAPRAIRTLDRFVTTLVRRYGSLPERFVVTLPKVTAKEQVAVLLDVIEALEARLGVSEMGVEIMVEHAAALLSHDGRVHLPELVAAARGRCVAAHLGTYDLTASVGIAASEQTPDHPIADLARMWMLTSLSGTGVRLSDGATTVLPIPKHRGATLSPAEQAENRAIVHAAWRRHHDDVRRGLRLGLYQGWDLHPAQLVSRYAAVFAFFRQALPASSERLRAFLDKAAQATRVGDVFDDAATGQGLLNFFLRAHACGAIDEAEVRAAGLSLAELSTRSFRHIVDGRTRRG